MKLYNRETSYYTIITIPKCLVSKYGKKQIWRSLNTKDYKLAKLRAELETMSIRRKLLNDLNKQKEKNSKTLDFAQILDDDDDDFFEDDIDIKDTVDFSHYTEEEFAKLDDFYAMANMSHQTYEKFKEIKERHRQQQKIQKALEKEKADNQIRSSIYDYDEQKAENLAYSWLIDKIETEKDRLKTSKNTSEDKRFYRENLNFYETRYINNEYSVIDEEMNLYLFESISPKPSQNSLFDMRNAFMRAKIQFLRYIYEYLNGVRREVEPELIDRIYENQIIINETLKSRKPQKPDMTLSEIVEAYNQTPSRDNTSKETKERVASKMNLLADIIGKDKVIRQITADDLQELVYTVPFIPSRFGSGKTANKTIQQAIKMAKVDETLPRLSVKTQNDYIQTLSSVFMWAKQKKFIDENPFDEVEMPAQDIRAKQGDKYLPFSITQLQAIFNIPVYRGCMNNRLGRMKPGKKIYKDAYFWVPLIALFSGARLNEICQLSLDDICIKEGINIININDTDDKKVKTIAGIRNVPIHPVLLKLGFLEYVEQQRKDKHNKLKRLFPELKRNSRNEYSAGMSKWFNRTLDKVNETIDNPDDKLQKLHVFHSFRHTVRTELRNHSVPKERVIRICGWEGDDDLDEHYGTISMKELYKTLSENIVYDGLDLSFLYVKEI